MSSLVLTAAAAGGAVAAVAPDLQPAESQADAIKNANFASARKPIFHYMLWADDYDNSCSSGNAFAIPNDTFIVTMGPKCNWTPARAERDQPERIGGPEHQRGRHLEDVLEMPERYDPHLRRRQRGDRLEL